MVDALIAMIDQSGDLKAKKGSKTVANQPVLEEVDEVNLVEAVADRLGRDGMCLIISSEDGQYLASYTTQQALQQEHREDLWVSADGAVQALEEAYLQTKQGF